MNFLTKVEAIQELCKTTGKYGAKITINKFPNKFRFFEKCKQSKILTTSDYKNNLKIESGIWNALYSHEEVIFGSKEEIEELLRIFEEEKGDNFICFNPTKTFVRTLFLETDQYETF